MDTFYFSHRTRNFSSYLHFSGELYKLKVIYLKCFNVLTERCIYIINTGWPFFFECDCRHAFFIHIQSLTNHQMVSNTNNWQYFQSSKSGMILLNKMSLLTQIGSLFCTPNTFKLPFCTLLPSIFTLLPSILHTCKKVSQSCSRVDYINCVTPLRQSFEPYTQLLLH